MRYIGEAAAFATAICWTFTGISFERAGKHVGSYAVNLLRLIIAVIIISIFNLFTRGLFFPFDATPHAWFWLTISGLIGFVLGDYFLFQSYILIGARISMVIMASSPILTAILGYFIFGEQLTLLSYIGMLITVIGIALVIFIRGGAALHIEKLSTRGIVYAFIGAFGQAVGFITSKIGMGTYNPFAATQIRLFAGLIGFVILYAIGNRWHEARNALRQRDAMTFIAIGAFFGPFLGVSFSLMSLQYTKAAIASTIMAMIPVLIIPFSIIVFKDKVSLREIFGATITVIGVAVMVLLQ